jgi:hypothetical protein
MGIKLVDINSKQFESKIEQIFSRLIEGVEVEAPTSSRFIRLKDGWVRDLELGVEWGPSSIKSMNFQDAEKHCVNVGGRLPTIKELRAIVEYDRHEPAIDTAFFPDTKKDYYWSSTKTAWNSGAVWCVGFYFGYVYFDLESLGLYVRPVRASQ